MLSMLNIGGLRDIFQQTDKAKVLLVSSSLSQLSSTSWLSSYFHCKLQRPSGPLAMRSQLWISTNFLAVAANCCLQSDSLKHSTARSHAKKKDGPSHQVFCRCTLDLFFFNPQFYQARKIMQLQQPLATTFQNQAHH